MPQHYKHYCWKNGKPFGIEKTDPSGTTYKIPTDPYYKWITIEQYENEHFVKTIYDSKLFDFRSLKPEKQLAWHKEGEWIRDQDDRLILIEKYQFEKEYCRECKSFSPHGFLVSFQKIYYTKLGDSWNGVILFDANQIPVMKKIYASDEASGHFTELLKEDWENPLNDI